MHKDIEEQPTKFVRGTFQETATVSPYAPESRKEPDTCSNYSVIPFPLLLDAVESAIYAYLERMHDAERQVRHALDTTTRVYEGTTLNTLECAAKQAHKIMELRNHLLYAMEREEIILTQVPRLQRDATDTSPTQPLK